MASVVASLPDIVPPDIVALVGALLPDVASVSVSVSVSAGVYEPPHPTKTEPIRHPHVRVMPRSYPARAVDGEVRARPTAVQVTRSSRAVPLGVVQPQQFNFKYMVIGIAALIDGNGGVQVTMGMRKLKTTLQQIKYVYVMRHGDQAEEVLICHETSPGKTKVFRANANLGDPEFARFVDTIAHYRPEADLRQYDSKAAHRMMGATNISAIVPVVMTALFTLGAFVAVLPWFIHGVDGGHAEIEVARFADADFEPESRNVTIDDGQFLIDAAVQIETTSDSGTSIQYAIPIVPPDWKEGDPVHVVLKTPDLSMEEAANLDPMAGIDGVLRNVLWEGLPADEADYLRSTHGLKLADDVVEVEYQADTKLQMYIGIGIVLLVGVLMTIVSIVVARKQKAA